MWLLTLESWHMKRDTWHMTCDRLGEVDLLSKLQLPSSNGLPMKVLWKWHMTCDLWHLTHDMLREMGFLSKFQLPSSNSFAVKVFWRRHVTHEMRHVTCNKWHLTYDMWRMTVWRRWTYWQGGGGHQGCHQKGLECYVRLLMSTVYWLPLKGFCEFFSANQFLFGWYIFCIFF